MRVPNLFLYGVYEEKGSWVKLHRKYLFSVNVAHKVDVRAYEPVVSFCAFMGCVIYGWDRNCNFDTMLGFAKRLLGGDVMDFVPSDDSFLRLTLSMDTVRKLSLSNVFSHIWFDSILIPYAIDVDIVVPVNDFVRVGSAVVDVGVVKLDLSGVSSRLDTRLYYSLRTWVGRVCALGKSSGISFMDLRRIFIGGDFVFNSACMYHFLREMGSWRNVVYLRAAMKSVVQRNNFLRDFVLYLGDDFYNYLPKGDKDVFEGYVDWVRVNYGGV